ncbi:MAG: putative monocarboxylate transporter mch1 [Geoglossum umbratile]|nr:MAG: putative monocarboxylate transporter mch1 [Geoglossum umbratile]
MSSLIRSNGSIDRDDFGYDARGPLLRDFGDSDELSTEDDERLMGGWRDASEGKKEGSDDFFRYLSFGCAMLSGLCAGSITAYSLYGHLFLKHLHYTQFQVNIVSITAELSTYLPVSIFGYLCDRYSPGSLSLISGLFFGPGYLLAAYTYRQGPPVSAGGNGWPFSMMVLGFVGIGMGTSSMYISAITTCAKNFGRGRHKGFALAMPIAAFGLSGFWQSQIGSRLLCERRPDGSRGDVDVFRFFLFLGITLFVVGVIGAFGLRVVGEGELIDEGVEELERSGLLSDSEFFRASESGRSYGALDGGRRHSGGVERRQREADEAKRREEEERRKKTWLLNEETRIFLSDHTMWWLAAGFFLVTGTGETFINNMGTIIGTLYHPSPDNTTTNPTSPATHVSIIAIASTFTRIFTGTISDYLAPAPPPRRYRASISSLHSLNGFDKSQHRFTISRLTLLVTFAFILSLGQVLLATGAVQQHGERFWAVSALIGSGYGAAFSLTPVIISVVWGVENFGTNWGIVAMAPALGATVYSVIYSWFYQRAVKGVPPGPGALGYGGPAEGMVKDILCYGKECYAGTFWIMSASVWVACGLWIWAWKGPSGWSKRGIAV